MVIINKTAASVLEGKHPHEKIHSCATLEMYHKTPIFILVDITQDTVKYSAKSFSGDSGPGGTDPEALQGWIIWGGLQKINY